MENENLQEIANVLAANPEAAHFMADLCNGVPLAEGADNHFGQSAGVSAPANSTPEGATDFSDEIARAEERGYLRGRNEAAAHVMAAPAVYQAVAPPAAAEREPASRFLSTPRQSFWDLD